MPFSLPLSCLLSDTCGQRANDGPCLDVSGSSNSGGLVLKADPTLGYSFNRHFQTYFGLPVYFVNASSTIQTIQTSGRVVL